MSSNNKKSSSLTQYIVGFVLSIIFTVIAFGLVYCNMYSWGSTVIILIILAFIQFLVQIVFFMHIKDSGKPNWNLYSLIYVVIMVVILVIGSAWIMNSLHSNLHADNEHSKLETNAKHNK